MYGIEDIALLEFGGEKRHDYEEVQGHLRFDFFLKDCF